MYGHRQEQLAPGPGTPLPSGARPCPPDSADAASGPLCLHPGRATSPSREQGGTGEERKETPGDPGRVGQDGVGT